MFKLRKRPRNKTLLFKELLASSLVEDRDGFLHGETLIWKIRECPSGLMIQFSDGVINVLKLEERGAYWFPNEKQTTVVSDSNALKHRIKKKVLMSYYKKVGKLK
jgi:hypothetical protein